MAAGPGGGSLPALSELSDTLPLLFLFHYFSLRIQNECMDVELKDRGHERHASGRGSLRTVPAKLLGRRADGPCDALGRAHGDRMLFRPVSGRRVGRRVRSRRAPSGSPRRGVAAPLAP